MSEHLKGIFLFIHAYNEYGATNGVISVGEVALQSAQDGCVDIFAADDFPWVRARLELREEKRIGYSHMTVINLETGEVITRGNDEEDWAKIPDWYNEPLLRSMKLIEYKKKKGIK